MLSWWKKEVALYSPPPSGQIGYCLTWTEREAEWWRKGGDLIFPFRVEFRIPNSSLSWKRESKLKASRVATTRVLLCWFLFVFVKSFVLIVLPTHPPPLKMWICLYWKCSYLIYPHTNFVFSQFKAPKDEENTPMGSKKLKDWILTCWSE